jgi:hypothetical protein
MKGRIVRSLRRLRGRRRQVAVYRIAILCGLIAGLAASCGPAEQLLGPANREPNVDIPLPRTTRLIRVLPAPTTDGQESASIGTPPLTTATARPTPTVAATATQSESFDAPEPELTSDPQQVSDPGQSPAVEPYLGMWLTREELGRLPTSGPAWESLKAAAESDPGRPDLSEINQKNNVLVLAKALVYARTGEAAYRDEVVENLMEAIGTEQGGSTLALGRNLVAYVVAADLVNLPADPEEDRRFREWLRSMLDEPLDGNTLRTTNEKRPNNWGTHAGASRAAVALYLGDEEELERTARIFKGYLGDREIYDGFEFGKLWWQDDRKNPVAINPVGATIDGISIDGALTEEMRRGGKFKWPPKETGYPWGALQGALVQAELLYRAGYDTWEWEDQALLRAATFLYGIEWSPEGDDAWLPWLINYAYGTDFPAAAQVPPGKNMAWTDWTHSADRASPSS